ncbi:MAG: pyridoxal phosphate-dependent aminotransferase [Lachnospiraceae bacterium]|nr:pyridoxal phosphate-dependent aminotransferase [Lachnospiraceae bacterium]
MYDFDTVIDRRGTDSLKWNMEPDVLPMWVADMDFPTAPEIREALAGRVSHGVFGYTELSGEWYDAYTGWWKKRHGFEIEKDWLIFSTGVIPTLSSCVRRLTAPNENVVILTPVYNIFFNSILNNGARVLQCPLIANPDSIDEKCDRYVINWDLLEQYMKDPQTTLMIFCNPHNPTGTVWDRDTLSRIGELAKENHVTVISDEIHCDLTDPGTEYIPFAAASPVCRDVSITCIAPTKAFNIAGLLTSAAVVPDPDLRHKVWRALNTDECGEPGAFAVTAAVTAFTKGGPWLDELRQYLSGNKSFARSCLYKALPEIRIASGEATYLLWLDLRAYGKDSEELQEKILKEGKLYLSSGEIYGDAGEGFLRLNAACPRSVLEEGLKRLTGVLAV